MTNPKRQGLPLAMTVPDDIRIAFLLLGLYGTLSSPSLFLTGSFVGLHIIAGACIHLVIGAFSLLIAWGFKQGRYWALWAAIALSIGIVAVTAVASFEIWRGPPADWAGAMFPLALSLLFAGVLVRVLVFVRRASFREE